MKVFAIVSVTLLVVSSCAWAAPSLQDNQIESDNSSTLNRAAKYLSACFESDDVTTCLAVKGITAMQRAARSNNIEVVSGVIFKRDPASPAAERRGKAMSENDIYAELPKTNEERNERLVDMAMTTAADFLTTHNLEVKFPTEATQEMARALEEGRGKMKKMMGPLALAIGAKLFAIIPIVLGGLALLTAKAVIVAKIALVLALLVGGSRIFGGFGNKFGGAVGGGYNTNGWSSAIGNNGWSSGGSAAYPYARSIDTEDEAAKAQELAYAGQRDD